MQDTHVGPISRLCVSVGSKYCIMPRRRLQSLQPHPNYPIVTTCTRLIFKTRSKLILTRMTLRQLEPRNQDPSIGWCLRITRRKLMDRGLLVDCHTKDTSSRQGLDTYLYTRRPRWTKSGTRRSQLSNQFNPLYDVFLGDLARTRAMAD